MGKKYGYARVSTVDQEQALQQQIEKLDAACDVTKQETGSGTSMKNRPVLNLFLEIIGEGDSLVVVRLDRLARSLKDLTDIVDQLQKKNAALVILDQNIDTGTASGRAFLGMLGVFAQFETEIRKERQLEGIAKAKKKGIYKGRKKLLTAQQADELKERAANGEAKAALAREYGISRQTLYQYLTT